MLLTPDEARRHWCPLMRAAQRPDDRGECSADGCMAWRWASALTIDNPARVRDADGNPAGQQIKHEAGYCGLAGRP